MMLTKIDVVQWMWDHPWAIALNAVICFGTVFYLIYKK